MTTIDDISQIIQEANSVLIATHIHPDPDAIGSAFGLAKALKENDIPAQVYLPEPLSERFSFLAQGISVCSEPVENIDLLIGVDTATKARLGGKADELITSANKSINIDHHFSNENWAEVNYIDDTAAASALIVTELLNEMGFAISSKVANLLFAGLADDTGSFRFGNTSAESLRSAALLVDRGADPELVANGLYFSTPRRAFTLRAKALSSMQFISNDRLGIIVVPKSLLEQSGAIAEDTEGLVDEARSVEGVVGAALIRELDDGWKVSLRAKADAFDASAIAQDYGGGGHKAAAGYKTDLDSDIIISELEEKLNEVLDT